MKKAFLFLFCLTQIFSSEKEPILFMTFHKGGTHLLQKTLHLITNKPVTLLPFELIDEFVLDPNKMRQERGLDKVGQHLSYEFNGLARNNHFKWKKILLLRDPRDVAISHTHWMSWIHQNVANHLTWGPFILKGFVLLPFEEQITSILHLPDDFLSIPSQCRNALHWMNDPEVLVCRFEDLVGTQGGGDSIKQKELVLQIANHIGYQLEEEEAISISTTLFGDTFSFRKGEIGSWETSFTPYHKELCKTLFGKELIELGYERDFNW